MPILVELFTRDEIRELYKSGLSVAKIADKTGLSRTVVYKICDGLRRSVKEAALLRPPKRSDHWRTARYRARVKMERALGRKLTSRELVHHIDNNYLNNDLSNLKVVSPSEHKLIHLAEEDEPCR